VAHLLTKADYKLVGTLLLESYKRLVERPVNNHNLHRDLLYHLAIELGVDSLVATSQVISPLLYYSPIVTPSDISKLLRGLFADLRSMELDWQLEPDPASVLGSLLGQLLSQSPHSASEKLLRAQNIISSFEPRRFNLAARQRMSMNCISVL
jgi:hypothetical protein